MILKWSQSGHRTSGNEPIGLERRSASTAPRKPVTCGNAIIDGTRGHAKTPDFGSSNPTSTAIPKDGFVTAQLTWLRNRRPQPSAVTDSEGAESGDASRRRCHARRPA
jgi:hypothetical protein